MGEGGLCVVSESANGIHPLLRAEANIMRLPISRDFPELEFYLERTQVFSPVSI